MFSTKYAKIRILKNGWHRASGGWWHPMLGRPPLMKEACTVREAWVMQLNKETTEMLGGIYDACLVRQCKGVNYVHSKNSI